MQFDNTTIGKATIIDQHPAYDFVYDVDVPVRLIVQASGHDGEGAARLLGVEVGCRRFRAYGDSIDVKFFDHDDFYYPAMNRVGASLEAIAAAVIAGWLGDVLALSWEYGHEIDDKVDIPFAQACTGGRWHTAPEVVDDDPEPKPVNLPASGSGTVIPETPETLEVFEYYGEPVVDLAEYGDKVLPNGWRFVLENNCYTGWSLGEGNGIRYARVESIVIDEDEEEGFRW